MPSSLTSRSKTTQELGNELQPPVISSKSCGWKNILVEEFRQPPGQETYQSLTEHTLCLSLNGRPSRLLQVIDDRRHTSLSSKGDLSIAPTGVLLLSQWEQQDHYLRLRLASSFVDEVAQTIVKGNLGQIEVLPEFCARNSQIEQISLMLLNELQCGGMAGQLYVEPLTTALAVNLLRHSAAKPCVASHIGGLSHLQLLQVTDYIYDRLADEIQLTDLAELLGLSQFHFSRLFKQSVGVPPYQYLLQQRVERAKQLLRITDQSIMEIALRCGFSSHSHLGKWFRHFVGMTPKAFRSQQDQGL
jgi:AraC family transcriptional regulator